MNRYVLMMALLLNLAWPSTGTARFDSLYEVQVPVADQSAAERARALEQALREVAVRVSGMRQAAQGALAADSVQPGRVVQQYGYLSTPEGLKLQVRFEPGATEQLLRQQGLPIWAGERPTTLVWLALQDGADRRLLGTDDPGVAGRALRQRAEERAVPLILPLLDLEDQSRVRFADVWGGFFDSVRAASQRYGADAVLVGRLERQHGGWLARWTLFNHGETRQWNQNLDDLEAAAALGVDGLADALAARYTEQFGGSVDANRVGVWVEDVRTLEDYAQLSRFLRSRESVRDARLVLVNGDRVRYELDVRGGQERLARSLRTWERFVPVSGASGDAPIGDAQTAAGTELQFRLVP